MRLYMHALIALFAITFIVTVDARAQQVAASPDDTVRVTLTDGDVIVGTVESETEASIVVLTISGVQMTIPREQVRSIESLEGRRFDRMDPNRSRLLFSPTGRSLEKGRGYVASYQLFFPFVAYGPGGNVTLAGGVSLLPGSPGQVVYAAPKITLYERQHASVAAGVLASTFIGGSIDDDVPTFGLLYAVGTLGSSRAWLTGGLAFGFADGEISKNPAVLVAGELQLSNSVKLMSENYVFINVDRGLLMSGGVRFFGERIAADLAMVTFPALFSDIEGFPFFPWIGFAYNFGP